MVSTSGTTEADTSTASHEQTSVSASQTTLADTHIKRGDNNDPDIFVLGFQELDLSTEALLYSTKTTREDAWCAAVLAGLGERAAGYRKAGFLFLFLRWRIDYFNVQLISKQLVGMLIIIIVKKELVAYFGDVQATSVGAGILGLMVSSASWVCLTHSYLFPRVISMIYVIQGQQRCCRNSSCFFSSGFTIRVITTTTKSKRIWVTPLHYPSRYFDICQFASSSVR